MQRSGKARPVTEVIDQVIQENLIGTWLVYIIIALSICGGVAAFVQAFLTSNWLWSATSGVPAAFLWPALQYTLKVRKQNQAIRLLEIPLNLAETQAEAAQTLQDFFVTTMKED